MTPSELAEHFRALHRPGDPLLIPNPWDLGSARLLEGLGFQALATTSSGYAASLGRVDGEVNRGEAIEHSAALVRCTPLPVSADLESGFGTNPDQVAQTYTLAAGIGLAGASIEDAIGRGPDAILGVEEAAERVQAAADAAHAATPGFVLTARSENYFHGRRDLADTIARLQAYQAAGADALYAPGLTDAEEIRSLVASVDLPVNVLFRPTGPTVERLAELGVARISVGGSFAFAAYGALADAARQLLNEGTCGYAEGAQRGHEATAGFGVRTLPED